MKAMIRGREATGIHNTVPDGRYKLSVFKLAEFGKLSKWKDHVKEFPAPLLKRAQKAWKEFADIILSKEFEKELCVPPLHFKHPVETRLSPIWNLHGPRLKSLLSCVAGYGSSSSPRRPRAPTCVYRRTCLAIVWVSTLIASKNCSPCRCHDYLCLSPSFGLPFLAGATPFSQLAHRLRLLTLRPTTQMVAVEALK
jgi:hypothetical protein